MNNKNVYALIAGEFSEFYLHSLTNDELEIFNTARGRLVRYWNLSFIVSELVQVNPDNLLAECVNL